MDPKTISTIAALAALFGTVLFALLERIDESQKEAQRSDQFIHDKLDRLEDRIRQRLDRLEQR